MESSVIIDKSLFSGDIYNWLKSVKISCKISSYSDYEYTAYAYLIPNFIISILKNLKKNDDDFFLTGKSVFIEPRSYTNHYKKVMKLLNIDKYNIVMIVVIKK